MDVKTIGLFFVFGVMLPGCYPQTDNCTDDAKTNIAHNSTRDSIKQNYMKCKAIAEENSTPYSDEEVCNILKSMDESYGEKLKYIADAFPNELSTAKFMVAIYKAEYMLQMDRPDFAITLIQKETPTDNRDLQNSAYILVGNIYLATSRYDEAISEYEKVKYRHGDEESNESIEMLSHYGKLLAHMGREDYKKFSELYHGTSRYDWKNVENVEYYSLRKATDIYSSSPFGLYHLINSGRPHISFPKENGYFVFRFTCGLRLTLDLNFAKNHGIVTNDFPHDIMIFSNDSDNEPLHDLFLEELNK